MLAPFRVLPVCGLTSREEAGPLADALVAGGLPLVEVTLRTPDALSCLAAMALHRDLLVGAGTVRTEQYRAVDLEPWQRKLRSELGLAPYPTLAVVSRSCAFADDLGGEPGEGGPVIILTGRRPVDRPIPAGVELISIDDHDLVPADKIISTLGDRGFRRVLCEGGPQLVHALHAAGVVDEICLTLSPLVIGGYAKRTTTGGLFDAEHYRLAHCITADDQALLLRYLRTA